MKDRRKVKVCKWCNGEYTVGRGKGRQGHCGKKRCAAKEYERRRQVERAYRRRVRAEEKELVSNGGMKICRCGTRFVGRFDLCQKCLSRKATTYNIENDFIYA